MSLETPFGMRTSVNVWFCRWFFHSLMRASFQEGHQRESLAASSMLLGVWMSDAKLLLSSADDATKL